MGSFSCSWGFWPSAVLALSSLASKPNGGLGYVLSRLLALRWVSSSSASVPSSGLGIVIAGLPPLRWAGVVILGVPTQWWFGYHPGVAPSPSAELASPSFASVPSDGLGFVLARFLAHHWARVVVVGLLPSGRLGIVIVWFLLLHWPGVVFAGFCVQG